MATGVHVKICGVTRLGDAERAVAAGAWAVGMVFAPGSRRRCRVEDAVEIGAALQRRAEVAGVFVNASLDYVERIADQARLTLVQLHGDEGPSYADEVRRATGCRVVKAMPVRSGADVQAIQQFRRVDFHLLDGGSPGQRGGTGTPFEWQLARQHRGPVPLLVSGGLTPDNVAEAIVATRPFGVDVASGVEAAPGIKDPERVEAFMAAVRGIEVAV